MNKVTILYFTHEGARATLVGHAMDEKRAKLINLYSPTPLQGHATEVLQQVVDHADYFGLTVDLLCRPGRHESGNDIGRADLLRFYEKFGFKLSDRTAGQFFMTRLPQN